MIQRLSALPAIVFLGLLLLVSVPADADLPADAQAFVSTNGEEMLAILGEPSGAQRRDDFHTWLREVFDLDVLASLALGPYRQSATPEQLAAYNEAFASYIVVTYEARFDAFAGYTFQVGQAKPMNNDDVAVRTSVIDPAGKPVAVDFRVRRSGNDFKVVDVAVEGLSMLKTQRDEFSAVIQREGLDGLIASLQQRSQVIAGQ
jgi:phospholipid transport system substrate-binding protein